MANLPSGWYCWFWIGASVMNGFWKLESGKSERSKQKRAHKNPRVREGINEDGGKQRDSPPVHGRYSKPVGPLKTPGEPVSSGG